MANTKVYEIVTEQITKHLEQGVIPWRKPWHGSMLRNYNSNRAYRGINMWLLGVLGYSDPRFITMKQANKLGGRVRKGEKAHMVVFWKKIEKEEMTVDGVETKRFFLLRYYYVFNVEQIEGWTPKPLKQNDNEKNVTCEQFMANLPEQPKVGGSNDRASYNPMTDEIRVPSMGAFDSAEDYYSTLFHEVTHWTGAETRQHRFSKNDAVIFGNESYSKEELVAEMGAAYCCGICQIENKTLKNSAAYIAGWLKKLKSDPKLVVQAAAQAQRAVDWMTGTEFKTDDEEEQEPKKENEEAVGAAE